MLIEWKDEFSTNVPEIDKQHKEIIKQLNKLHDSIMAGHGNDTILKILEFARTYASKHFAYEESCMDKYQCPYAKENKDAHEFFIQRFEEIEKAVTSQEVDSSMVIDIYRELKDWVESHILKIDVHLRKCVKKPE